MFSLSAYGNKIPDLSYFEGKNSEDVSNILIGNNIDKVINSWGKSNENCESEKTKNFPRNTDTFGFVTMAKQQLSYTLTVQEISHQQLFAKMLPEKYE